MIANINFSEINQLLSRKGINVTLSGGYNTNSFRVYYPLKFLFIKNDVTAIIHLLNFDDSAINLKFSIYGLGNLENRAKKILKDRLPAYISMTGTDGLKVNLGDIAPFKALGIHLKINSLLIDDSGIAADLNL